MTREPRDQAQFYMTSPSPCAYLEGREERKVFTHLVGRRAPDLNDTLTHAGFRRSQTIAYRPACEGCSACISIRIPVDEFKPTRSMRRVMAANRDLIGQVLPNRATSEHYALFRDYLKTRHPEGGMADMSVMDFTLMVEDSHVTTEIVDYRRRGPDSFINGRGAGPLLAAALIDVLSDGVSMVYSFYAPEEDERSLGTFMILDQIERTRKRGLPYLYLGYFIEESPKMAYKARFLPQERLSIDGWHRVES